MTVALSLTQCNRLQHNHKTHVYLWISDYAQLSQVMKGWDTMFIKNKANHIIHDCQQNISEQIRNSCLQGKPDPQGSIFLSQSVMADSWTKSTSGLLSAVQILVLCYCYVGFNLQCIFLACDITGICCWLSKQLAIFVFWILCVSPWRFPMLSIYQLHKLIESTVCVSER